LREEQKKEEKATNSLERKGAVNRGRRKEGLQEGGKREKGA